MSALEQDIAAARKWLVEAGLELVAIASEREALTSRILDKVQVIAALAALPGPLQLRIRCTPNVFKFKS